METPPPTDKYFSDTNWSYTGISAYRAMLSDAIQNAAANIARFQQLLADDESADRRQLQALIASQEAALDRLMAQAAKVAHILG